MSEGGDDQNHLIAEGKRLAERAVQFDKDKQLNAAIFYYNEAANVMQKLFGLTGTETFKQYATQYKSRAGKTN